MGFLLAGDRLAPEAPGALPHGEEDLGEAFDFEDSDEEDDEDSAAEAEPSRAAVLQAPPRRRRATSSSIGEGPPRVPKVSPLGVRARAVLAVLRAQAPTPFLCFFSLCRGAGAGDPGRVSGVLGWSGEKKQLWRGSPFI